MNLRTWAVSWTAALLLTLSQWTVSSRPVQAQTLCSSLPAPLYFPATTLIEGYLDELAPYLADPARGSDQMTVVYLPLSSCSTYDYTIERLPFEGTMRYWSPDGSQQECEIPAGSGIVSNLNAMDLGGRTCRPDEAVPTGIKEFPGHVEVIGFVVPQTSSQRAITATEGYFLMKFGAEADRQVSPWTNPERIVIRNPGSSTQLTIGAAVGWSGKLWSGSLTNTNSGSGNVRDKVIAANGTPAAEETIGILNSGKWDKNRDSIRHLAFQPFNGCLGAVFADSTSSAFDKRNVRDGHYPIWTNIRFITEVDASGEPIDPRTKRFIDIATGVADVGFNTAQALITTGNIPTCAMRVKRDVDGGPLSDFAHPAPCDCFFEETIQAGSSGCAACVNPGDCESGVCRNGWCEAR